MHCLTGTSWRCPTPTLTALHRSLVMGTLNYSVPILRGISVATMNALQSVESRSLHLRPRAPRGTKTSHVRAEAGDFPLSVHCGMESIRYYLRSTTRNFHHPVASVLHDRPDSLFSMTIDSWVPCVSTHEARFDTWKTPLWSTIPFSIYSSVPGVARKVAVAPLVAKQLSLSHMHNIHFNCVEFYTDGSTTGHQSTAALYIPKLSVVHEFK